MSLTRFVRRKIFITSLTIGIVFYNKMSSSIPDYVRRQAEQSVEVQEDWIHPSDKNKSVSQLIREMQQEIKDERWQRVKRSSYESFLDYFGIRYMIIEKLYPQLFYLLTSQKELSVVDQQRIEAILTAKEKCAQQEWTESHATRFVKEFLQETQRQ